MINSSLFQSIKGALAQEKNNSGLSEIMKTEVGNTYTVRLLPFTKDPKKTFFHYYQHGWTSFATGQYVATLSPQTFGERDPIAEERYRLQRTGTEAEKEKAKSIGRSEKWLVNVFVVNDPTNPDNNGKVKILRYGKQLQKIITDAIEGEDAEEFGPRIFDLSTNGVNFKIKCENQGEYPTYVSSRFTSAGKLSLSESEQKKIYDSVYDLTKVYSLKSYDELKQMFDEHFLVKQVAPEASTSTQSTYVEKPKVSVTETHNVPSSSEEEDDISELLKGIL